MSTATSPTSEPNTSVAPSLSRRMACWLYEGILLFGVVWIAAYLFSALSQSRHALDHRTPLQIFLFIVFGIYFVWFWHKGQTLAMKTWHLRVVDLHGAGISQKRALLRYVFSWLWFLPPLGLMALVHGSAAMIAMSLGIWIIFYALLSKWHRRGQFLHDALAGTQLIAHAPMSKHIPA